MSHVTIIIRCLHKLNKISSILTILSSGLARLRVARYHQLDRSRVVLQNSFVRFLVSNGERDNVGVTCWRRHKHTPTISRERDVMATRQFSPRNSHGLGEYRLATVAHLSLFAGFGERWALLVWLAAITCRRVTSGAVVPTFLSLSSPLLLRPCYFLFFSL